MYNCVDAEGGLENQWLTAVMDTNPLLDFHKGISAEYVRFKIERL